MSDSDIHFEGAQNREALFGLILDSIHKKTEITIITNERTAVGRVIEMKPNRELNTRDITFRTKQGETFFCTLKEIIDIKPLPPPTGDGEKAKIAA
ncbi:MAG TPA: hypothetical protein VI957_03245 [Candidatus Paceibacterota bacterium]